MKHSIPIQIYYEDTDAGGVVYYGNYLKFAERGRTEMLRALGFENKKLQDDKGLMFVVRHVDIDYLKPGFLDDALTMHTSITTLKNSSFVMRQTVCRGDDVICDMKVTLVCVEKESVKPAKVPEDIRKGFEQYLEGSE